MTPLRSGRAARARRRRRPHAPRGAAAPHLDRSAGAGGRAAKEESSAGGVALGGRSCTRRRRADAASPRYGRPRDGERAPVVRRPRAPRVGRPGPGAPPARGTPPHSTAAGSAPGLLLSRAPARLAPLTQARRRGVRAPLRASRPATGPWTPRPAAEGLSGAGRAGGSEVGRPPTSSLASGPVPPPTPHALGASPLAGSDRSHSAAGT